jgi:hypothetical protein
VINAAVGAGVMHWVAVKYDGTAAFMATQMGSYAKLPTWIHDQLTPDELGAYARGRVGEGGRGGS